MSANDRAVVDAAKRLPELMLPSLADGSPRRLRPAGRRNPLVVMAHGLHCADCLTYILALAAEVDSLREWDGYPIIVLANPALDGASREERGTFPLLSDPDGRVATALGLCTPAVAVADQWGEVHLRESAGEDHRFPVITEVLEWLRFLAIQCPECQGEAF